MSLVNSNKKAKKKIKLNNNNDMVLNTSKNSLEFIDLKDELSYSEDESSVSSVSSVSGVSESSEEKVFSKYTESSYKKNSEEYETKLYQNTFNYKEYYDEKFLQKLGQYTFGLDKIIPWEDGNFVFSGGLLFDILRNRYTDDLMDIDLFFFGSSESKYKTINKILDRLDIKQYYYLIGLHNSVIYIFVQGIPRIIQLIMTDKTNPKDIISSFDLTNLMFYFDGSEI